MYLTEVKMQQVFKYYWVINPVRSNIENFIHADFTTLDRTNLVNGKSPLGEHGKVFFDASHHQVSLYDHSLWVFCNEFFGTQEEAERFSNLLRMIAETLYNLKLSRPGLIIMDADTDKIVTKQPPNFESTFSCCQLNEPVEEIELKLIFDLCKKVISLNSEKSKEYESIFDYLRDIRRSPRFVGELALWSFLEHHWATDKADTNLDNSFKKFLEYVFDDREERREFRNKIKAVGNNLGQQYNEQKLRNILAHGKHITLSENWSDENWTSFYKVHEELFSLVLKGIEIQINNET